MDDTSIWVAIVIAGAFIAGFRWHPTGRLEDAKGWIIATGTVALMFGVPMLGTRMNEDKCSSWWEFVGMQAQELQGPNVDFERALYLARLVHQDTAPLWCPVAR